MTCIAGDENLEKVVEQIQPGWVELFSTKNVSNKIPSGRSN
jgi:hypothetical protein